MQKTIAVSICIVLVILIPHMASYSANKVVALTGGIDPEGAYLWATVHHMVQLGLTLIASLTLGIRWKELGFNLNHLNESLTLLKSFAGYFIAFILAGHIILFFTAPAPVWTHSLTAENVIGELTFKAFLSGTAEEPLFRGLIMVYLYRFFVGQKSYMGVKLSHAGVISVILFTIAHIGFEPFSLRITWISPIQLLQAFILGTFYAYAFDRTKSLLTPILAHNFANLFLTSVGMVWALSG